MDTDLTDPTPFDVEQFKLSPNSSVGRAQRPAQRRSRGPFLRGPIPWSWLVAAGQLKGHALQVGLVLWFEAGCRSSRTVRLRHSLAAQFGCHRDTVLRAVRELERAGLVNVQRKPGRSLQVTLLDAPSSASPTPEPLNATNAEDEVL